MPEGRSQGPLHCAKREETRAGPPEYLLHIMKWLSQSLNPSLQMPSPGTIYSSILLSARLSSCCQLTMLGSVLSS